MTRNGNSSVRSTLTKYFCVTSVLRLVKEKITFTILRVPLRREGRTSTPVSESSLPLKSMIYVPRQTAE